MAKYILNKHQIKRLIDGKHVIDGHGRKLIAGENVKGVLQKIDENNLYDKLKVVIENGELDILKNE